MEENNEKKIVIVEGNDPKGKKNWTWNKYFSYTWKNKFWVLGFSLIGALGGLLGIKYGYNDSRVCASITFSPSFPTLINEESGKETYFDGSDSNILSIISKSNLEAVKSSSDSFKSINIDNVLSKNGITISKVEDSNENEKSGGPVYYVLTGNAAKLGGKENSKKFIVSLIENEKKRAEDALNSYKIENSFTSSFSSLYLPQRNKQLLDQYNLLDKKYNYLLTFFGPSYYVDGSLTLASSYSNFVSSHYASSSFDISSLSYELMANCYAYFEDGKQLETASSLETKGYNYIESAKEIANKIDITNDQIESLSKSQSYIGSDSILGNKIIELSNQKASLLTSLKDTLNELKYLGFESSSSKDITTLSSVDELSTIVLSNETGGVIQKLRDSNETSFNEYKARCNDYYSKLDQMKDTLEGETSALEKYLKNLYLSYNDSYSIKNGAVSISGGISSILGAVVGLLLLYIISSCICTAIEIGKENLPKNKNDEEKVSE